MSGLATGRSPAEYLRCGAAEERALSALCFASSSSVAAQVFKDCLVALMEVRDDREFVQYRQRGLCARVVVLMKRILDREAHHDATTDGTKAMECSLAGAFSSARAHSDHRLVAVLVCLSRRLFLPIDFSSRSDDSRTGFEEYEKWLRDMLHTQDARLAKVLVSVLSDLLPLEPIRFLRTNHRVFSGEKQYFQLFGDYLVQVRSKISDVDPFHSSSKGSEGKASFADTLIARRKTEASVVKFVRDFAESGGEIPGSLVRQMTFHRHHFRSHTLPILLDPDLDPKTTNDIVLDMTRDKFDDHRANLIRVMAFIRKDNAITRSEGQDSIKEIEKAKRQRFAEGLVKAQVRQEPNSKESNLIDGNNLVQTIERLFHSSAAQTSVRDKPVNVAEFQNLVQASALARLQSAVKDSVQAEQLGAIAGDLLQGLLNGMAVGKCDDLELHTEDVFKRCKEWWDTDAVLLHTFLITVFGHQNLRTLQKPFQYNLFFLTCIRIGDLARSEVMGMAKLFSVILLMNRVSSIADICFASWSGTSPHVADFVSKIFISLPLRDPASVRNSAWFATNCVALISSLGEEHWPRSCHIIPGTNTQDIERITAKGNGEYAQNLKSLLNLLQWALCMPWRFTRLMASHQNIQRDDKLIEQTAVTLKSMANIFSTRSFGLRMEPCCVDLLEVEFRCGWGRPSSIRKILRTLHSYRGQRNELIAESSAFIAVSSAIGPMNPAWITEGVYMFAEDTDVVERTNSEVPGENQDVFLHHSRKCVQKAGTSAGRHMLDILSRLPCQYFHGCDLAKAGLHLCEFLLPCLWPFSHRLIKFLVKSLQACGAQSAAHNSGFLRNAFLLSNVANAWEVVGPELESKKMSSFLDPLLSSAAALDETNRKLENRAAYHSHVTQTPHTYNTQENVGRKLPPVAQGVAFALRFSFRMLQSRPGHGIEADAMLLIVKQLVSTTSVLIVGDVLDAVMCTFALIPFTYCFAEFEGQDRILRNLDNMLSILLSERLRLDESATPVWVSERVARAVFAEGNLKTLFVQWLGISPVEKNGPQRQQLETSLPVGVCLAKVLSSIMLLSEEDLSLLVSTSGHCTVSSVLIANILTVYRIITANETTFRKEKLCEQGMEQLMNNRFSAASALMDAISHLTAVLQSQKAIGIARQIDETLQEFPDHAEEVRLLLSTRNKLIF